MILRFKNTYQLIIIIGDSWVLVDSSVCVSMRQLCVSEDSCELVKTAQCVLVCVNKDNSECVKGELCQ